MNHFTWIPGILNFLFIKIKIPFNLRVAINASYLSQTKRPKDLQSLSQRLLYPTEVLGLSI